MKSKSHVDRDRTRTRPRGPTRTTSAPGGTLRDTFVPGAWVTVAATPSRSRRRHACAARSTKGAGSDSSVGGRADQAGGVVTRVHEKWTKQGPEAESKSAADGHQQREARAQRHRAAELRRRALTSLWPPVKRHLVIKHPREKSSGPCSRCRPARGSLVSMQQTMKPGPLSGEARNEGNALLCLAHLLQR